MPDIIEVERTGKEEIIIIGCDGIWEKYEETTALLTKYFLDNLKTSNSSDCLKAFFEKNINSGTSNNDPWGRDNMTAILM